MQWRIRGIIAVALITTSLGISANDGDGPSLVWKSELTHKYLDDRAEAWLNWSSAARGKGTSCISCHGSLPYALARSSLSKLAGDAAFPAPLTQLIAGVRTRVEKWDKIVSVENEGDDPLIPFYGGARRDSALDTESVLNALVLVATDRLVGGKLDDATNKALDHMWQRQQADGGWRWLDFGLRPWEKDGEYFGAALGAVAIGTAGDRYPHRKDEAIKQKIAALRKNLKTQLEKKPFFHNRALGLWADSHLKDVFTEVERKQMVADLFSLQSPDGGWSLGDLGKSKTSQDSPGWKLFKVHPNGAVSDGYATGLVVIALKRTAQAAGDERLKRGVAWLTSKQRTDGTWPVAYINKERNPDDNIGKFMQDAGSAFAALALAEP